MSKNLEEGGIGEGSRNGELHETLEKIVELTEDPTDEDIVGHLSPNLRLSLGGGNSYTCAIDLSVCVVGSYSEIERNANFQASICFRLW